MKRTKEAANYLDKLLLEICHQDLTKIGQSGHTGGRL